MSQAATAYAHPKLNELIRQAGALPFIGQVLIQTVRDLVHPQDRILACYYQLETSNADERGFSYYSIDVVLITSAFFIRIVFYPNTHTCVKKRIFTIADMKIEYPAPSQEALLELTAGAFLPRRITLGVHFTNERGESVETWTAEANDPERVMQLMEVSRLVGRLVGMPLSQAQAPAPTGT